ncbi:MAG: Fe-S cluster assembly protein SufD [Muribaculaceae bacterium]|nr:Fe-S cluster assembly protein SufD [Muribaculaceae bacterium]
MKENSLKQYIDLYDANVATINGRSAGALNARRAAARQLLDNASLPSRRTPDYEKSPVGEWMAPDRGVNVARVAIPVDLAATLRCGVPNMSPLQAFVVNDAFVAARSELLPEGVTMMSLKEAAEKRPELVERYYGTIAPETPLIALNDLLAQDGVFIHVAKGVATERPLQVVNILSAPISLMATRRVLIVVEDDARLQLLTCDHTQDNIQDYLVNQVVEVSLGRNASLDLCEIEESSAETYRVSTVTVNQAEGSRFGLTGVSLTSGHTRNNYIVNLLGEHASAELNGMAVNSDSRHVDNCTRVNHLAPRCHSNQMFKYVLDDESTGAFEGEILVDERAPFTEAYQTNRNILASAGASMHTTPRLLIYNDDVKCSHGATTGQLDSEALFYMQTRGIPVAEARTMLMQAFMVDVVDSVKIEGLRDRLRHLVERRFAGDDFCDGCNLQSTHTNE